MQRCSKCGLDKSLDEFAVRSDRPGVRYSICRACRREYGRAHYAANVDYYLRKAARARDAQRSENVEQLVAYLRTHPCVDCGETDVLVLQFDHLDATDKLGNVSDFVRTRTWASALREIAKCVVRCANCHRRKTAERRTAAVGLESTELKEDEVPYAA